jgi:hypothetical protein
MHAATNKESKAKVINILMVDIAKEVYDDS